LYSAASRGIAGVSSAIEESDIYLSLPLSANQLIAAAVVAVSAGDHAPGAAT